MTTADSSQGAPASLSLGGQLAELRQHISGTKRRIEEEEVLLREARKRLQALHSELSQSTEREAQLVRALGGAEAAAAAVAAATAGGYCWLAHLPALLQPDI